MQLSSSSCLPRSPDAAKKVQNNSGRKSPIPQEWAVLRELNSNIMKHVGNITDKENSPSLHGNADTPYSKSSTLAELSSDCKLQGNLEAVHDSCEMHILEISDGRFNPAK